MTSIRDALVTLIQGADDFAALSDQVLARNEGNITTQIDESLSTYGIVLKVWPVTPNLSPGIPGLWSQAASLQIDVMEWPQANETTYEAEDYAEALLLLLHQKANHGIAGLGCITAAPQPFDLRSEFNGEVGGDITVISCFFRAEVTRAAT